MIRWKPYPDDLRTTRRKASIEDQTQMALVEYVGYFAVPDLIFYMVPNAGQRSKAAGGRAKAMGLKAGVYDLAGALPGGQAFYLELKTPDGVLSPAQIAFGELAERNGSFHQVCYNLDDAITWLRAIGALKPEAA